VVLITHKPRLTTFLHASDEFVNVMDFRLVQPLLHFSRNSVLSWVQTLENTGLVK